MGIVLHAMSSLPRLWLQVVPGRGRRRNRGDCVYQRARPGGAYGGEKRLGIRPAPALVPAQNASSPGGKNESACWLVPRDRVRHLLGTRELGARDACPDRGHFNRQAHRHAHQVPPQGRASASLHRPPPLTRTSGRTTSWQRLLTSC